MAGRSLALALLLAGLSMSAGLIAPTAPFPGQHLYVASPGAPTLLSFDPSGQPLPGVVTGLESLHSLAFGPEGALYATDFELDRVLVFTSAGMEVARLGAETPLNGPTGLAFGPSGGLYVASSGSDTVLRFERDGNLGQVLGAESGLDDPRGLAFSPDGRLWVSSHGSDEVLVFDRSGALLGGLSDAELMAPYGLAISPSGHLFVASHGNDRVLQFDLDGSFVASLGADTDLNAPTALALGPERRLYVASSGNDTILVFDGEGELLDVLDATGFPGPTGLAFSPVVFSAALKGRLRPAGGNDGKIQAQGRVTWAPGSGRLTLLLTGGQPALSELLGTDALVLHGFEATPQAGGKLHHLVAREIAGQAQASTAATLGLSVRGVIPKKSGRFEPRQGAGDLQSVGPAGTAEATLKLKALK